MYISIDIYIYISNIHVYVKRSISFETYISDYFMYALMYNDFNILLIYIFIYV